MKSFTALIKENCCKKFNIKANARKSYIIEYKAGEFVLELGEVKLHFEYINNTLNKYQIC